jgi:hypothetical protein
MFKESITKIQIYAALYAKNGTCQEISRMIADGFWLCSKRKNGVGIMFRETCDHGYSDGGFGKDDYCNKGRKLTIRGDEDTAAISVAEEKGIAAGPESSINTPISPPDKSDPSSAEIPADVNFLEATQTDQTVRTCQSSCSYCGWNLVKLGGEAYRKHMQRALCKKANCNTNAPEIQDGLWCFEETLRSYRPVLHSYCN